LQASYVNWIGEDEFVAVTQSMFSDVQRFSYLYYGELLVNLRVSTDRTRNDVSIVVEGQLQSPLGARLI